MSDEGEMLDLIQQVRAERAESRQDAEGIRDSIVERCREAVEEHHGCRPVVAALTNGGAQLEHFFPVWENDKEKREIFEHLNTMLEEKNTTATVVATHGHFIDETLDDVREIRAHENKRPAIIVICHTLGWKEMLVLPYRVKDDTVHWDEPVVQERFETNLINVPRSEA